MDFPISGMQLLLFLGIFRITNLNFVLAVRHKVECYVKLLFYGGIIEKVNYKVGKQLKAKTLSSR